ncbi:DUF2190 family protein [Escherichia coli]|uniref:DUF2190 family protein n=1 Tax=Escherichia coli TaxID=562 RepID=UPI0025542CCC|nr:capsid cement protein [Escherichia coli]
MLNQETAKAARTDSGYILRAPRRMRVADAVAQYMRVGDVFAVALTDIPQGETGDGMTEGVFMLPKLKTDDMKTGKKVYLKSGKVQLTNSGSDPLVGVVWADAGTSAEEVPVKLNV